MTANDIIIELLDYDSDLEVRILMPNGTIVSSDFVCDSWRGSYNEPFATIAENTSFSTVSEIIANLEEVEGLKVTGYKGGNYVLNDCSFVYLEEGPSSWSGVNAAVTGIEDRGSHLLMFAEADQH